MVAARTATGAEEDVFYDAGAPTDGGDDSAKPER